MNHAQENLDLGLANDHRVKTPLEASEAYMQLSAMYSHRGDGIPTQYVHGAEVAELASTLWIALLTALRPQPHSGDSIEGDGYYWFKAERATGRSIAQRVNGQWFTVNETGPITLEELMQRGWHIDERVR